MILKNKIGLLLLLVMVLVLVTGCAQEATPYEINNAEGYTVSVKYDANGGTFTTNTSVIVDSYNLSELPINENGKSQIALLAPDAGIRGNDAFAAIKNGYFLAGWYSERYETVDAAGNTVYTYSGLWDFESSRMEVDPAGSYSAQEPVLTLYAAWVPLFEIEFYDRATGEHLGDYAFDPMVEPELAVPAWDQETGAIEMYQFPQKAGYTFETAYYDELGTQPVDTPALIHSGVVDKETGTCENPVMKVYLDWTEGEWYHIYNTEQFLENASVSGHYEIHADLDFDGKIWPTSLMHGNFSGSIQGNGHTMKNIAVEQTNNSKVNTGLFGALSETANISDLTFEKVSVTIKGGTRVTGSSFGLLAGTISNQAQLTGVKILSGQLNVDAAAYFGTDDYVIGLLCGMGSADVEHQIQVSVIGEGLYAMANSDGLVTLSTEPFGKVELPVEETAEETEAEESAA